MPFPQGINVSSLLGYKNHFQLHQFAQLDVKFHIYSSDTISWVKSFIWYLHHTHLFSDSRKLQNSLQYEYVHFQLNRSYSILFSYNTQWYQPYIWRTISSTLRIAPLLMNPIWDRNDTWLLQARVPMGIESKSANDVLNCEYMLYSQILRRSLPQKQY